MGFRTSARADVTGCGGLFDESEYNVSSFGYSYPRWKEADPLTLEYTFCRTLNELLLKGYTFLN